MLLVTKVLAFASALFFVACTSHQRPSPLQRLELKAGMNRLDVEKAIAKALNKELSYSPYGNNLRGGKVHYHDAKVRLSIVYAPGSAAPWVKNKEGVAEHFPPIDERLESFTFKKKSPPKR